MCPFGEDGNFSLEIGCLVVRQTGKTGAGDGCGCPPPLPRGAVMCSVCGIHPRMVGGLDNYENLRFFFFNDENVQTYVRLGRMANSHSVITHRQCYQLVSSPQQFFPLFLGVAGGFLMP